MISTLLVANRGEIAVRVVRACRELGVRVVVAHSTADRESAAVQLADDAVQIGPAPARLSYLNAAALIEAARRCGADAVHPGYGFLSEDPDFAEICAAEGLTFIGPPAAVMARIGDKSAARVLMGQAGLPLLPGTATPVGSLTDAARAADRIGYPVMLKASAGGGGRGMSVVRSPDELAAVLERTRAQARAVFGDPAVYLERYLMKARHVEIQVLCDSRGNGVHLGERDCSVQRRHQKLLEESPCGLLDDAQRTRLGEVAVRGALSIGFTGAGTFEFLLDDDGRAYFMELNARIQVEHPVTELRTGIDLVREQILVSDGAALSYDQGQVCPAGASIECRINAEDPTRDFAPTPGRLVEFSLPSGPWTRVDTGYRAGDLVGPNYDSLLAKVIVWAPDRRQAIARMERALAEFRVAGPGLATTLPLHRGLLRHPAFRRDEHTTTLLDRELLTVLDPAVRVLPLRRGGRDAAPLDPLPLNPSQGGTAMPEDHFTIADLKLMLTRAAGVAASDLDRDPSATLTSLGVDSLAFLALQTALMDRFGFELPDEHGVDDSLPSLAAAVDQRLRSMPAQHADAS